MTVLMSVWPVLKSLPADRHLVLLRQLHHRRHVHRQVRRAVRVRHAFHQRGVGVDHRRGDRRVVRLEALLERLDRLVRRRLGQEDLGAAAPDHHEPVEVVVLLEGADVLAQLLGQVALVLALLDVRAVEALDVLAVEDGLPRLDGLELRAGSARAARSSRTPACLRRLVAVVLEDVPAAEHDVVQVGERHEVLDERASARRSACRGGWCPSGSSIRSGWRCPCGRPGRRR